MRGEALLILCFSENYCRYEYDFLNRPFSNWMCQSKKAAAPPNYSATSFHIEISGLYPHPFFALIAFFLSFDQVTRAIAPKSSTFFDPFC